MSTQSLGITAKELFACNPYRILGVPVDATAETINEVYKKLLSMADTDALENYKTKFDFPSLPPFKRDEQTVRTAYVKLASMGYKCFAYSDGVFSTALNVDDVALNLKDIRSYDCFLRCYMWLITNDTEFEEQFLWVKLCRYIDKMIASKPEEWPTYFDHRFPEELLNDSSQASLTSFYKTFCDIILLPIKEMAKGTMKCRTAIDILKSRNIDVDQDFPEIEIPWANKPRRGEPVPKLKIAVKDGEEYYDVDAGEMKNFEAGNESAVESNSFNVVSTKISAETLSSDTAPVTAPVSAPEPPTSAAFKKPKAVEKEEVKKEETDSGEGDINFMPRRRGKVKIPGRNGVSDDHSAPKIQPTYFNSPEEFQAEMNSDGAFKNGINTPPSAEINFVEKHSSNGERKRGGHNLKDVIDVVDKATDESSSDLSDDESEEENIYADALIKMLRSNRSTAIMKSVDTKRVYDNGDKKSESDEEKKEEDNVDMEPINMKRYDKNLLNSNFESMQDEDPKKAREAKYRDISVTEMINPTIGNGAKVGGEILMDPIEEYKIQKKKQKQARTRLWKALGFVTLVVLILLLMYFLDII